MNDPNNQSPDTATPELGDLPELNRATLDWDTVEQLFHDVASLTQVLEVIAKTKARSNANDKPLEMAQGLDLLKTRQAMGVQLRYLHDGVQWWDTLMWRDDQIHLVRIRHDFGGQRQPS